MISPTELLAAAMAIRDGKLVAFPTETVYGLGANALDAYAVARIFAAKGRPASSPLIVHIASIAQARALAAEWPRSAQLLAERFWPGPLTLVVKKADIVPDNVSAGLDTVGIRMPANAVALELIRQSGVPIAAPSANRFTELSPTRAEHVRQSLGDRVAIILDGGPALVGIESTVVALSAGDAELLRPGMITREQIESIVGPVTVPMEATHRSPGQHARHYRPRTPLFVTSNPPGEGTGVYLSRAVMPADPHAYAALLYDRLHELDTRGLDWIAVEPPPPDSAWDGVRDRLERARSK